MLEFANTHVVDIMLVFTSVVLIAFIFVYFTNKIKINYLKEEHKSMQRMFEQTTTAFVNAIDAKDRYTHGHSSRVAGYSRKLAEMNGKTPSECEAVFYAALLHDVGKIGVPSSIINKDGNLS